MADTQTEGHGDYKTDEAQRAESVKIILSQKDLVWELVNIFRGVAISNLFVPIVYCSLHRVQCTIPSV